MDAVFTKLQCPPDTPLLVLDAPASFAARLATLPAGSTTQPPANGPLTWTLSFVTSPAEVAAAATRLLPWVGEADVALWMAYPKRSSALHRGGLHRDAGWQPLEEAGFETVRAVAIDDDWTALRFRRTRFVGGRSRG